MSKAPTATPQPAGAEVLPKRDYAKALDLVKGIRAVAEIDDVDNREIVLGVIDKIAGAETLDELFDASEKSSDLPSLRDWEHLGEAVLVVDVRFRKSNEKFRNATGSYVAIDAILASGELDTVSTGADNVVTFLRKAQLMGELESGLAVKFRSRETENGALLYVTRP